MPRRSTSWRNRRPPNPGRSVMLMGAKVVGLPVPFGLIRITYRRTPVVVVYFKVLRDTETLATTFLLKLWEVGALLKEVCVGPFEVLQCLLQGLRWHRGQEPMLQIGRAHV